LIHAQPLSDVCLRYAVVPHREGHGIGGRKQRKSLARFMTIRVAHAPRKRSAMRCPGVSGHPPLQINPARRCGPEFVPGVAASSVISNGPRGRSAFCDARTLAIGGRESELRWIRAAVENGRTPGSSNTLPFEAEGVTKSLLERSIWNGQFCKEKVSWSGLRLNQTDLGGGRQHA
jgi:hypothetical protein